MKKNILLTSLLLPMFAQAATISWDAVTGASHYLVQVKKEGGWGNFNNSQPQSATQVDLSGLTDGNYYFRVGGCVEQLNVTIHCGESIAAFGESGLIRIGAEEEEEDKDFIIDVPSIAKVSVPQENTSSTELAVVPGNLSISNQGAANYNIPIQLPKGKGGVTPGISLSYSSLGGNQIAGLGWSLSASSAISRCQKNLEEHGEYSEILFNQTDALCYGGEKLRLVEGNNLENGAEYRLDKDGTTKILQINSGADSYFVMYLPSGEQNTFGNTADSTLIDSVSSNPYTWKLSKKQNSFQQQINYTYNTLENQESLLSTVAYSDNTVSFEYEDRTDQSTHYYLGNKIEKLKRLSKIKVKNHNNVLVSSYHFNYRSYDDFWCMS